MVKNIPERKLISVAVSHIRRNGEKLHENSSQINALSALGIEKLQNLRHFNCKLKTEY
jgi:hypothetical protein